jgi:hypothetical protein
MTRQVRCCPSCGQVLAPNFHGAILTAKQLKIASIIEASPGLTAKELSERVGCAAKVVIVHVHEANKRLGPLGFQLVGRYGYQLIERKNSR